MKGLPIDYFPEQAYDVVFDKFHGEFATGVALIDGWEPTFGAGTMTGQDRITGALTPPAPLGLPQSILTITDTAVDDQFMSLWRTYEEFRFVPGQPIRFRVDFPVGAADQDLDDMSLFVGCLEAATPGTELLDAGAGPILDADKFGFYKAGETGATWAANYWWCVSSFGANQQATQISAANPANLSGVDYKQFDPTLRTRFKQSLIAEFMPTNLVPGVGGAAPTLMDAEIRFWINGILVAKHVMNGTYQITTAASEPMNFGYVSRLTAANAAVNELTLLRCTQLKPSF